MTRVQPHYYQTGVPSVGEGHLSEVPRLESSLYTTRVEDCVICTRTTKSPKVNPGRAHFRFDVEWPPCAKNTTQRSAVLTYNARIGKGSVFTYNSR